MVEDLQYKLLFETVKLHNLPNQASFHVLKEAEKSIQKIFHFDCYFFFPILIKIYTVNTVFGIHYLLVELSKIFHQHYFSFKDKFRFCILKIKY